MKLKVSQFVSPDAKQALSMLYNSDIIPLLWVKTFRKLLRTLKPDTEDFTLLNNSLITKYGKTIPNTDNMQVEVFGPNWLPYLEELQPLLDEEVELDIEKIDLDKLLDAKGVHITAAGTNALDWLWLGEENHDEKIKKD